MDDFFTSGGDHFKTHLLNVVIDMTKVVGSRVEVTLPGSGSLWGREVGPFLEQSL